MKNRWTFFVGLAIIMMNGCVGLEEIPTKTPSVNLPSSTNSAIPYDVTVTPKPATTPDVEIPPEAHYGLECLDISPALVNDMVSTGTIIMEYQDHVDDSPSNYLLNMETGVFNPIYTPDEYLSDFSVSPNFDRVAYRRSLSRGDKIIEFELVISDANLQPQIIIPLSDEYDSLLGWKDEDSVLIRFHDQISSPDTEEYAWAMSVINILDSHEQIFRPILPDIYDWLPLPYWDHWGIIMYDPSLTRIVYMRGNGTGAPFYTLLDPQTNQVLASPQVIGFTVPRWSYDGTEFIISGMADGNFRELYSIGRDGEIKQLTHLTAYDQNYEIVSYSWSPDGRYIALLIDPDNSINSSELRLAVLDTITSFVTDFCVQVTWGGYRYRTPIWSPDSTQLVFKDWYSADHSRVVLVDIIDRFAAYIAQDMEPQAWLKNP